MGFSRRMQVVGDRIVRNTNQSVRRVALAVDQALVMGTPVDKGIARSNWRVGLGQAPEGTLPAYAPGEKLGIGESANASAAMAHAQEMISRRQPGQDIYIVNNVHYIGKLNEGSSAQAPANFVEQAIQVGAAVVPETRIVR